MARFWYQESYRSGFCEKLLEASLISTEPMPAESKMNPVLAKAKPISDGGSTSGMKYLRGKPLHIVPGRED